MTAWGARWRFPVYLRLWLAVVAAVAVLTVAFGWLWRISSEQQQLLPERELIIRNEAGEVVAQDFTRPQRNPQRGLEFVVDMKDGSKLIVQLPPRRTGGGPPAGSNWMRGRMGFLWMLGIVALAVAIGAYPIIRRLTRRVDELRQGVERWGEGDLSVRIREHGSDELAFLAQRFNHAAERIETLIKAHKSLLANASHELRSPLTRIRMGMELMGPTASPGFQEEIRRCIGELDQLIDEILLASRLDSKESDMGTIEQVDLTGLVAEECARTDAELVVNAEASSLIVDGVAKLLRRAVRNLLENARRYSSGPVTAVLRTGGGFAELRVNDHGPGVPPDMRERIFEPFYRLPGASERHGGVGLGLSLVRSIAERHHGSVRCEDAPGGGASFALRLPVRL